MVTLCKLKIYSLVSSTLLKPYSHLALHNQHLLLVRHLTTTTTTSPPEISPGNHQHSDFTVNYLTSSCGLSLEGAVLASKWVQLQSQERPDTVLGFLKNHGFSETQISQLCRGRPQILSSDPDKILLPKIEYMRSFGVSNEELAKLLAYNPAILGRSLQKRIIPTFDFLTSMLTHKNALFVIKHSSHILLEGHSNHVVPNIGILRELGMPQSHISLLLTHCTRALMRKPEKFRHVVNEVKQMGFNVEKSTFVLAIKAFSGKNSKSIWNRSRQVYMTRWGWSEDDVISSFRRFPMCMVISEKKIMKVMEFLVNEMGWSSRAITICPVVLGLSLEKRIIPRCSVVKVLLLKGFIDEIENVSLSSLLNPAEKCFLEKFVAKYIDRVPQLLSVYQGKVGVDNV